MAWQDIDLREREELLKLYELGDTEVIALRAVHYGMKPNSLERKLRDHRYYRDMFLGEAAREIAIPFSPSKVYCDYERVKTDDVIIISDIEIPDHNEALLKLAMLTGMANGIKNLGIGDDLHVTDQGLLVSFVATSWITVIDDVKSYPNTPSYRLSFDFWRYTRTSWSMAAEMGCCGRLRQTISSPNRSTAAWSYTSAAVLRSG